MTVAEESSVKCLPQTQEYSDGECQSALVVLICLFQSALVCGFLGKVKRLIPSLFELLQLATTHLFPFWFCRIDCCCCCKFDHVRHRVATPTPEVILTKWWIVSKLQFFAEIFILRFFNYFSKYILII